MTATRETALLGVSLKVPDTLLILLCNKFITTYLDMVPRMTPITTAARCPIDDHSSR